MRCAATRRDTSEPCPLPARWRLSVVADPWPLQYACDLHIATVATYLGGNVRASRFRDDTATPAPRAHDPAIGRPRTPADPTTGPRTSPPKGNLG